MPDAFVFRGVTLDWARPYIMGVVNVTPDSFSDGGAFAGVADAVAHGLRLAGEGADLLDVGGEATNPRATPIDAAEEIRRIVPVIERLAARTRTPISVDTTKAEVARAAVAAGAEIVNDVSGGLFDPEILAATAEAGAAYICGHLRGRSIAEVFAAEPTTRGGAAAAPITWREVAAELSDRMRAMPDALRLRTWIDPGLGFGKGPDPAVNGALIRHAGDLAARLARPIVLGPSRKRFLARMTGADPRDQRALDAATVGACLAGVAAGAHILRVHDPGLLRAALVVYSEIRVS